MTDMLDQMIAEKARKPGRPPLPRDAAGNIIRGEQAVPEVPLEAPEQPDGLPEPSPAPTPEPETPLPAAEPEPEVESPALNPEPVDDWSTVIVAGIGHFASRPGSHQQEALAMMAIHRAFKDTTPGPAQPFVTECVGCGNYRCEGVPDAPNCPTCGHPFPVWEARP